jgi:DNA-binding response OmpR family regulator/HPt (histidine-containing phosphotransfer) domain-containing protein
MRILVIEDNEALLGLLLQQLHAENYAVDTALDGFQGWEYATTYEYDLLILDVMLPGLDGVTLCKRLRQAGYTLPILILTAQDSSLSKTIGLDAGADDYVVKPFNPQELVARIRALLRRSHMNPIPILTWGELWLNTNNQDVSYAGVTLDLTSTEYALLEMMMQDSQQVLSKEDILESLWSAEEFPSEATVRSHMRRLRQKLIAAGAPADLIATSHGRGYYLKPLQAYPLNPADASTLETVEPELPPHVLSPRPDPTQQAQYLDFLNQTWQNHRDRCLERVQEVQSSLRQLQMHGSLDAQTHQQAHQIIHTLVGTLGTFGLKAAMESARHLEQELHPDIYLDSSQVDILQQLLGEIQQHIEATELITTLPNFNKTDPDSLPQTLVRQQPANIRVMIVDDDPILLQTLPKQLQSYGLQVSTLNDPQQFWSVLQRLAPDVLILDIQMPVISGLELCQALRTLPHWQKLPVMFLSVFADAQTQHEAFAVGADDYLCKPINAQNLSNRIFNRLHRIATFST